MKRKIMLALLTLLCLVFKTNAQVPYMVKDINPGKQSSNPTGLMNINGTLYFSSNDGENGEQLWQ